MLAWRTHADRELLAAAGAAILTALLGFAAVHKWGLAGLLVLPAGVAAVLLVGRPHAMIGLLVGAVIVCEGPTFGFLPFTSHLYDQLYKGLTPLDVLVALTAVAAGLDAMRNGRALRVPLALAPALGMLVLGMVSGVATGRSAGVSLRDGILSEHVLAYLLVVPVAVANLELDRRQVTALLSGLGAVAVAKACAGLIEIAGHYGASIEGTATLTYYEPTSNWLVMISIMTVLGLALARVRPPLWVLLGTPLLVGSLILSYRRSFWIAAVLCLALVALLGSSPAGRRMLVPVGLLMAVAIWLLASVNFQSSQAPIVKRVASLAPTHIEANVEDRYRLDERANVIAAIERHPLTGLGMEVPWPASARPLSVEHPGGRLYVHFASLWFWLKLGILGLISYVLLLGGTALLAWRAWRAAHEPLLRAFALASLAGVAGLAVIETTATFTGVDPRFTVLLGAQIGVLSLLARPRRDELSAAR